MSKPKILIVENDDIVAMNIESRLKKMGYDVCGKKSSGKKAIEAVKELSPDLVLMDIVLKGKIGGISATKIIQSRFGVPVVFLTAHNDDERFERAKAASPFGYIIKPIRDREFKITIEMALYSDKVNKERINTEEALKESEKKYSMLFKSGSDAVVIVDVETMRLIDGNEAAQSLYGYSHEELLQLRVTDLSTEPEITKNVIQKGVETAIPVRYHKKKDDTIFPVEIRTNFFEMGNRKINIGNIRDISERVKAEKEKKELQSRLLNSQKMESVGQLAAGVAHEINNPVGFVGSNLDALNDYMKDIEVLLQHYQKLGNILKNFNQDSLSDAIKKQIQTISKHEENIEIDYIREDIPELLNDCRDGTKQIGKVVGDLKSFAHPGKDRQMLIDINKGLESTLNVVNNELKYKATITKKLGKIPMVEGYPQKLNQVFMNILVNAAQAIKEQGEIKIQTKKEEQNVIISISDTGCGIEKKDLSRIFDPFFTTKDVGKGTGLGMNISYNIIQEHKGTIDVESQVGNGTTFIITLPGKF